MDDRFADDDLRALRAADPAAGAGASAELQDRVTRIPGAEATPVPLRRRRRWLVPAAAATVIAAIGVGYAWTGGTGGLGETVADRAPLAVATGTPDQLAAPIGLGGDTASGDAASGDAGSRNGVEFQAGGVLPGRVDAASGDSLLFEGWGWGWSNRHRFVAPAFETVAAQASVYALDGRARYSAGDATRMAAALGVTGEAHRPQYDEHTDVSTWRVGEENGPAFSLHGWGGAGASYSSGIHDPWSVCEADVRPRYDLGEGAPSETWAAYSADIDQCVKDTPMPTEQQAREALSLFLAAIGVEEAATQITVTPDEQGRTINASAARIVENNATEIVSSVGVSVEGVLHGYGETGELVTLGEYPIVSADEAASRLNDPAFAPRLVSWPEIEQPVEEHTPPSAPPEVPAAGSAVPWAITEHEVVSARLGLALIYADGDGQQYLVPAYEFTMSDETVWSVLALAEESLMTAPAHGGLYGWR